MIGFFIAMLSGALMSVQGVFNTKLTESTSLWVANAFVQFTAFFYALPHGSLQTEAPCVLCSM